MRVEHYSFGRITVDGVTYTADAIIYPERVDPSWRRKEGHCLHPEDLADLLQSPVRAMVIGTGFFGRLKVPGSVLSLIESKGVEVFVAETTEAVKLFNEISAQRNTVACLHLTC